MIADQEKDTSDEPEPLSEVEEKGNFIQKKRNV